MSLKACPKCGSKTFITQYSGRLRPTECSRGLLRKSNPYHCDMKFWYYEPTGEIFEKRERAIFELIKRLVGKL